MYKLLARIFLSPPDIQLLNILKEEFLPALEENLVARQLPERLRHSVETLDNLFHPLSDKESLSDFCEHLSADFTFLFRGIKKDRSPPPPYESLYRDGSLYGDSTIDVKRYYRNAGIETRSDFAGEPPDHIGLELDFMSYLSIRGEEALRENDVNRAGELVSIQAQFLSEHLLLWIGALSREITSCDRAGFYSAVLEFAEGWVDMHLEECKSQS